MTDLFSSLLSELVIFAVAGNKADFIGALQRLHRLRADSGNGVAGKLPLPANFLWHVRSVLLMLEIQLIDN